MDMFNYGGIDDLVRNVKTQEALGVAKASDIISAVKAHEFMKKKEEEERRANALIVVCTVILVLAAIIGIAYGLYCYFSPDYLDDFDDDFDDEFDDDFDDDFFEDDGE